MLERIMGVDLEERLRFFEREGFNEGEMCKEKVAMGVLC